MSTLIPDNLPWGQPNQAVLMPNVWSAGRCSPNLPFMFGSMWPLRELNKPYALTLCKHLSVPDSVLAKWDIFFRIR